MRVWFELADKVTLDTGAAACPTQSTDRSEGRVHLIHKEPCPCRNCALPRTPLPSTTSQDRSGRISMSEFVNWSLSMARMVTGADVLRILQYDRRMTGAGLDELHFTRSANEMGFGEHAQSLFAQLPLRPDRTVDVDAVAANVRMPDKETTQSMREFLVEMSWNTTEDLDGDVDTTGWSFTGSDPESAREALRVLLDRHNVKLSRVFETLDTTDDNALTEAEFIDGFVRVLGFTGTPVLVQQIFASLDDDATGRITVRVCSTLEPCDVCDLCPTPCHQPPLSASDSIQRRCGTAHSRSHSRSSTS